MTSGTFSLADRDYIVEQLRTKVVEVDFTKRDGSKRTMKCTLRVDMLPPPEKPVIDLTKPERKDNPEVIAAYDLESKGWRSFRLDSIESITIRERA
jgi:hypothetical protein